MGVMKLRYVQQFRDRHGRLRTYFRFRGQRFPLPDPEDEGFSAEYRRLCQTVAGRAATPSPSADTLAWLVDAYQGSPEFKRLGDRTRRDYAAALAAIVEAHGDKRFAPLRRPGVMKHIRDPLADTPRKADQHVAVLSAVYSWAVTREIVRENPCAGVGKLYQAGEGYRAWSADEIARFLVGCTEWEFLVFALALYTGQRPGDLCKLTWFQYDGAAFRIRQGKTKQPLVIHAHPVLQAVLAELPRTDGTILAKADGSPIPRSSLSSRWSATQRRIGLRGCTLHGLRTTHATALAEGGASARQIMASTGHRTLSMVEHYTRHAEQARLSQASVAMLPSYRMGA